MVLEVAGRQVVISNPGKVYFPRTGHTKLDMVRTTWPWPRGPWAAWADGRWP